MVVKQEGAHPHPALGVIWCLCLNVIPNRDGIRENPVFLQTREKGVACLLESRDPTGGVVESG